MQVKILSMEKFSIVLCFFLFLILNANSIFSQKSTIEGSIKDTQNQALLGATIVCGDNGTISDIDGYFKINISDCDKIIVSYVGYETEEIAIFDGVNYINVTLEPADYGMDVITVTSSKYDKRLSENTVSIDVLKPEILKNTNTIVIDDLLDKVPGVQMLDGQANIRGGSGYSYGAGSRVMLLLDDIPALQADTGFPNWGDMPVEALGQVEVMKGAASALFGSAALNGIINMKRTFTDNEPSTEISTSYKSFLDPERTEAKWWDDNRYQYNIAVIHKRKIEKLDLIVHGMFNTLESYNGSTYEDRGRVGVNLRYRINNNWQVGLNTLFNKSKKSDFFLWKDSRSNILEPFDGSISTGDNLRYMIDPYVQYISKKGAKHKLQSRIHYINNKNNNNQGNTSLATYLEYQYQKKLSSLGLVFTAGTVYQNISTEAELLNSEKFTSDVLGIYAQLDKEIISGLNLSAGIRHENVSQTGPEDYLGVFIPDGKVNDDDIIMRFGLNAKITDYTFLRASYGEGYRFPTLTERYVSTTFSNFKIYPNPLLKPEFGWSAEIGIKQGVNLFGLKGFFDFAWFTSAYQDMIEFTFIVNDLEQGFKPFNVGNTKIDGIDIGVLLRHEKGHFTTDIFGGYTHINPKYTNLDDNLEILESLSTAENVLKYRSKDTYKIDVQTKYKNLSLGVSLRYASHQINIDKAFENLFGNDFFEIGRFRRLNDEGYKLYDARLSYNFNETYKLSFLINNAFNTEYSLRPGLLEAPRNITLRADVTL